MGHYTEGAASCVSKQMRAPKVRRRIVYVTGFTAEYRGTCETYSLEQIDLTRTNGVLWWDRQSQRHRDVFFFFLFLKQNFDISFGSFPYTRQIKRWARAWNFFMPYIIKCGRLKVSAEGRGKKYSLVFQTIISFARCTFIRPLHRSKCLFAGNL